MKIGPVDAPSPPVSQALVVLLTARSPHVAEMSCPARPGPSSRLRRLAAWLAGMRWALPAIALFTVLRIPSFLEPHWYTDEGGYATAARSLLQGRVLYSQVWNNKPPLHLWTLALDVLLFGGSEAGLHALTFLSGIVTLAGLAYLGRPVLGLRRTLLALLLAAAALGTPIFDAELSLPESLLIAPATWAAAIVLRRVWAPSAPSPRHWPVVAGVLAAAAMAYQQTAVADASALLLVMLLSPRVSRREVAAYAATVAGITAAWVVTAMATAGPSAVAFALVGFYVPYSQSALTSSHTAFAQLTATLLCALALICVGAGAARRSSTFFWGAWVWAGAELLVAGAAQMPYAHFLTASLVPVILALCSLPRPRLRRLSSLRLAGAASLVAGVTVAGLTARVAGVDWIPELATAGTVSHPRDLATYYVGTVSVLTRQDALDDVQDLFDGRVAGDRGTAKFIRDHGLSGRSAVAWTSDAWVYLMADLPLSLPTPPIYNDEVLLGTEGQVAEAVAGINPDVLVTSDDALQGFPEVKPLLLQRYRVVDRERLNLVWLRNDLSLPGVP